MLAFPPDATFVVQLVSFFVLLAVLNRLLFAPFGELLAERGRRTEGAREDAAREQADAQQLATQVEADLAVARAAALAEAEQIRRQTRQQEAELFARAKDEAAKRLAELRSGIAREREQARQSLSAESRSLAESMIASVLRSVGDR